MKFFTKPSSSGNYVRLLVNAGKAVFAAVILSILSTGAFAQTFTWSDSFVKGQSPTAQQCSNWNNFLVGLAGKSFTSVRISGSYDAVGISITDPAIATELAKILSSAATTLEIGNVMGSVVFEGRTWTVSKCLAQVCGGGAGVGLSIDASGCGCTGKYVIRPFNTNWGGVNTAICSTSPNQMMTVEFKTGVSITPVGPTTICEGEETILKATSETCKEPYRYLWSTGETTESIKVSESGNYSVQIWGANECSGVSDAVSVTVKTSSVDAGDNAIFCETPIRLGSDAITTESVSRGCLFDAAGGDCSIFTENICDDKYEMVKSKAYSGTVSIPYKSNLRFKLYYSTPNQLTTFTFRLNDNVIGTWVETVRTSSCTPILAGGLYPKTVSFSFDQLLGWKEGDNNVTVEVSNTEDVFVAGIVTEVSQSGFYTWSPVTGLSDATIANPLASPIDPTTYTVTYNNPNGCISTDKVFVDVGCGLTVNCQPVSVTLSGACVADVAPEAFLASSNGEGELNVEVSVPGPYPVGTTPVTITVTDAKGWVGTCSTVITVIDATSPTIAEVLPVTKPNDPGLCTAVIALPIPSVTDCSPTKIVNNHPGAFPEGTTTVTWTATDSHGNTQTVTQLVTVTNAAPALEEIVGPVGAVAVGTNAVLGITYTDDNFSHAIIDWGDGSPATTLNNPAFSFEAGHAYASAGSYSVNITLTDMCGAEVTTVYEPIDVFDPRSGSVNGGGRFDSPSGAYLLDPQAAGIANYSFDARYNGFSNVPEGSASFKFKTGNLKFSSTRFDLLLIDGETARLTGTGSVNGKPGYDILISMVDDDTKLPRDKKTKKRKMADRIRVMITNPMGLVIYDTQLGDALDAVATTHIASGSIEINNSTNTFADTIEDIFDSGFSDESTSVYPNPFIDYVNVQFVTESTQDVVITMMDISGRVLHSQEFAVSADAIYTLDVPDTANEGIYLVIIRQGARIEILTVVKN